MRLPMIKAKLAVLVASQIKGLRIGSGMTQKQLASAAGMLPPRICDMELIGKTNLTIKSLARLAHAFGVGIKIEFCSAEEMLRWENEYSQDAIKLLANKGSGE